jgi:hypothetical protein
MHFLLLAMFGLFAVLIAFVLVSVLLMLIAVIRGSPPPGIRWRFAFANSFTFLMHRQGNAAPDFRRTAVSGSTRLLRIIGGSALRRQGKPVLRW